MKGAMRSLLVATAALGAAFALWTDVSTAKTTSTRDADAQTTFAQTSPTEFNFTFTNKGPDAIVYWYFALPEGSTVTGATTSSGVASVLGAPDGKANEVEFGPAAVPANGQVLGTVMTRDPLDCTKTWQVVINTTDSPANYKRVADATGTCAPPPPPPPPPAPCKCLQLTARIVPSSVKVGPLHANEPPIGDAPVLIHFTLHWVLGCSTGSGGCTAVLQTKTASWASMLGKASEGFLCKGKCAEVRDGGEKVIVEGVTRAELAAHRVLPIGVLRICQDKSLKLVRLSLAFDASGRLALAKSKLR